MAAKKKPREFAPDPNLTVSQGQEKLRQAIRDGVSAVCPCCKQTVELYERSFTPKLAKALIVLHRHFKTQEGWVDMPPFLSDMNRIGADVHLNECEKLVLWGLLEEKPRSRDQKKGSAFYRMTERGHKTAKGEIPVPRTARIYNGKFMGFGPDLLLIKEALGEGFDYDQLMAGNFGAFV